jgi:hypothetical protein
MTRDPLQTDGGSAHEPNRQEHYTYHLAPDERPSEAVVRAVSAVTGRPVVELEPLYAVIDPDALDVLFSSGRVKQTGRVSFDWSGCEIVVEDCEIRISPLDDSL